MKISAVTGKIQHSSLQDPAPQDEGDLKETIKDALSAASQRRPVVDICPRCGQRMAYVDTVFSLYGTDRDWRIRVPVCCLCATAEAERFEKHSPHQFL